MMDERTKILVDCKRRMIVSLFFSIITLGILMKLTHVLIFQPVSEYIGVFWALTLFWGGWVIMLIIFTFLFFVYWGILINHMKGGD